MAGRRGGGAVQISPRSRLLAPHPGLLEHYESVHQGCWSKGHERGPTVTVYTKKAQGIRAGCLEEAVLLLALKAN